MKKITILIFMLIFGLEIQAQKLVIRPSISYAVMYSAHQKSTIPEPYFSTSFTRSSFQGLNIEWHFNKKYATYFKIANYQLDNTIREVNQQKPNLFDVFWADNSLGRGQFVTLYGIGIKTDVTSSRQKNKIYVNFGINLAIQDPLDFRGGISGRFLGSSLSLVRNFSFKDYQQKNTYPLFEIGVSHPFLNKRKKEILELSLLASHAFTKVYESVLDFEYIGPRYSSTARQQAYFASRAFSLQIVISKGITILKRKK